MSANGLNRQQLRAIDQCAAVEFGIAPLVLMENAGRGAADWLVARCDSSARVTVVCGPGNNGGDGGVVARHLDSAGRAVRVAWIATPETMSSDARAQYATLQAARVSQQLVCPASGFDWDELFLQTDWIVDALLGTGASRSVEGTMRAAIDAINRSGLPVLSLDIPSGLDADTGQALGTAVRATATATFVAPKLGFSESSAHEYLGEVVVMRIGAPRRLLETYGVSPC